MKNHNALLAAARGQRTIDRIIDRLMIAVTLIGLGVMIGIAMHGNP